MCCRYSLESLRSGISMEYPQHMFPREYGKVIELFTNVLPSCANFSATGWPLVREKSEFFYFLQGPETVRELGKWSEKYQILK